MYKVGDRVVYRGENVGAVTRRYGEFVTVRFDSEAIWDISMQDTNLVKLA